MDETGAAVSMMAQAILDVAEAGAAYPLERRQSAAKVLRRLAAKADGSAESDAFQAAARRLADG